VFGFLAVATLITVVPPASPLDAWPAVRPGKVLSTPDWSDYRVYPMAARSRGQEGRVLPELLVGTDGRPRACRIIESSRFAELDSGTCELMMKMRFEPAQDENGKSILSRFSRPIVWLLNDARPFASSRLKTEVHIENRRLLDCTVVSGDGAYLAFWSAHACTTYRDVGYFFGARADESRSAMIEVRLSAADGATFLDQPWPSGELLAKERLTFKINRSGDASDCSVIESYGFGSRDLNNLSPCGKLLSIIWFEALKKGAAVRQGVIETRVVLTSPDIH
jgi:TonB family protein